MSLVDLIRKRTTGVSATVTSATSAIKTAEGTSSVAKIAEVAVAHPHEVQTDSASRYSVEGDCIENLNTITAHALPLATLQTATAMTSDEEQAIRAWLTLIEETDPATIADVIHRCQYDPIGRNYLIGLAVLNNPQINEIELTKNDDRRTCNQCNNLIGRRCLAALRGEIAASRNYEPIRNMLMRCEGYAPKLDDPDQRSGRDRWPGLNRQAIK